MRSVCGATGGKTWFRIETEAEAVAESETMRHAVEKYFRKEQDKATQSFRPISKVSFEQEIGLKAHIQREMPLFLTLRDMDGTPLATAMLPPGGRDDRNACRAAREEPVDRHVAGAGDRVGGEPSLVGGPEPGSLLVVAVHVREL